MIQDPGFVAKLVEQYGLTGAAFGLLLLIILRQNRNSEKRIVNLEEAQEKQHVTHLSDQKQVIDDYVELVKGNTKVIADLTGCLKAIKETLERMERSST